MIVVQASSGTGNQLFQYAAARAIALRTGKAVCVDAHPFLANASASANVDVRQFVLGDLELPIRVIGREKRFWHDLRGATRLRTAWFGLGRHIYRCPGLWQPEFDTLGSSLLLGYFQDQRYLGTQTKPILAELDQALTGLAIRGQAEPVDADAGLHVRRSDYLHHAGTDTSWFEGYYARALAALRAGGAKRVAIYSDDPNWCQQSFGGDGDLVIMPIDARHGGLLDLWRLSNHPQIALCNSTFSWWAARLATERNARIIAPSRWAQWCADPAAALMHPTWTQL